MGDRIAAALSAAAFLFLCGVVYAGLTLPARPAEETYVLRMDAAVEGGVVRAQGRSNLPDGSRLLVYVDRLYRAQGSDTWSSARVGSAEAVVQSGRWQAEIPVDDASWVDEVSRRVSARALDPIEAVHSNLRASVVFSPHVRQPDGVVQSLGPNFERLSDSEQAVNVGDFWILTDVATVEMPLHKDLESKLRPQGA